MLITNELEKNNFDSKEDFKNALENILQPLVPFYQKSGKGRLKIGNTGSVYSEDTREIEAFLRPLWGIGPYLTSYSSPEWEERYLEGIIEGTNPSSPFYWGETVDYDQRLVEMASLATTLLLAKEKTWDKLSEEQQQHVYDWLMQINHHTIPLSNWLFFRILVNLAMKHCEMKWNRERVELDWEIVNGCYIDNGWYYDENPPQIDYYISFAIHFYSLLYYKFMGQEEPERATVIKERAVAFAQTFQYWFDEKGEALPFGRSLGYRFSQCAFWTALVYADIEALPWGQIKGLISRHMRQWMQKEIFTSEGVLTIGYHYPNLVMAEGYNAPGSPYWSLKTFLILAVPEEHPFWLAEAEPLQLEEQKSIPEARMLITQNAQQLQAFVAGQIEQKQAHVDAKYSKLVYSSLFGFSVAKGAIYYRQGGFDNCLALSEERIYYRSKLTTETYLIEEDRVVSVWKPWSDVKIRTTIIPFGEWHLRVHEIQTARTLHAVDGGFSVPIEKNDQIFHTDHGIHYQSSVGTSSIFALETFSQPIVQNVEPNTNLFFKRSTYPTVEATLPIGEHRLISLVGGSATTEEQVVPEVYIEANTILIRYKGKEKLVNLCEQN